MKLKQELSTVYGRIEANANPRLAADVSALSDLIAKIPSSLDLATIVPGQPIVVKPEKAKEIRLVINLHDHGSDAVDSDSPVCPKDMDKEEFLQGFTLKIMDHLTCKRLDEAGDWWDSDGENDNGDAVNGDNLTFPQWLEDNNFKLGPTGNYYCLRLHGSGPAKIEVTIPEDATELDNIKVALPSDWNLLLVASLDEDDETPGLEICFAQADDNKLVREAMLEAGYVFHNGNVCYGRLVKGE